MLPGSAGTNALTMGQFARRVGVALLLLALAYLLWSGIHVLLLAFAGPRFGARAIGLIACGSVFISFVLILLAFFDLVSLAAADRVRVSSGWRWLEVGDFTVRARLLFDPLAALLALPAKWRPVPIAHDCRLLFLKAAVV